MQKHVNPAINVNYNYYFMGEGGGYPGGDTCIQTSGQLCMAVDDPPGGAVLGRPGRSLGKEGKKKKNRLARGR